MTSASCTMATVTALSLYHSSLAKARWRAHTHTWDGFTEKCVNERSPSKSQGWPRPGKGSRRENPEFFHCRSVVCFNFFLVPLFHQPYPFCSLYGGSVDGSSVGWNITYIWIGILHKHPFRPLRQPTPKEGSRWCILYDLFFPFFHFVQQPRFPLGSLCTFFWPSVGSGERNAATLAGMLMVVVAMVLVELCFNTKRNWAN